MHELVAVRPIAEHARVGAVGDPIEEDPEDAESTVPQDRARPDDGDIESGGRRAQACPLGGQLGVAVGLRRLGDRRRQNGVGLGNPEHGAGGGVHDLRHADVPAGGEHVLGALDVDRAQQERVLDERDLGDVVEHRVRAVDCSPHDGEITDVALDDLDAVASERR